MSGGRVTSPRPLGPQSVTGRPRESARTPTSDRMATARGAYPGCGSRRSGGSDIDAEVKKSKRKVRKVNLWEESLIARSR